MMELRDAWTKLTQGNLMRDVRRARLLKSLLCAVLVSGTPLSAVSAQRWYAISMGIWLDKGSLDWRPPYVGYQIKTNIDSGEEVIKSIVANCEERTRLEARQSFDWSNIDVQQFSPVQPGSSEGLEVLAACTQAALGPPRANWAIPKNSAPLPAQGAPKAGVHEGLVVAGSGVAVESSKILTNAHVVRDCRTIVVHNGAVETTGTVVAVDDSIDLALLRVPGKLPAVPNVRATALLGEDITVAGYPLPGILGTDLIVTGGQVNALAGIGNDPTRIQISAPIQPGNSGGPILDRSGNLSGLVVSKLKDGAMQNVNFGIKPEIIRLFLAANGVVPKTGTLARKLDGTILAGQARTFTFQIECH